ncbi:MAG TPA: phage holin family protein [Gaiellaceae bacterium]|nr:phage holin family protein [Gaiellaceae bacterium]
MATRGTSGGLGGAVRQVAEHATAIAKLEAKLALGEVARKAKALGLGAGLLAGAGLFGLLALVCGLAGGIAALALVLPVWAAILVVGGGLLLLSGLLGLVGLGLLKRGVPPVPEQAIHEARLTTEALKNGRH